MMGEEAFSGIDQGSYDYSSWAVTVVNLSILSVGPNSSIKFRWELGSDGCNGITGWFLDDIVIYNCSEALAVNDFDVLNNNISIYPNPSSEYVNISLSLKEAAQVKINIYDIHGKIVQTILNEKKSAGSFITTWNRSNIASGVYILEIDADGRKHNSKLILN